MSDFKENVFKFIKEIPEGKVATYGQIAMLAGSHRAARQVGMLLNGSSKDDPNDEIPWQRVINAQGGISTHKIGSGELQRALLEEEGIVFNAEGLIDLRKFQWQPEQVTAQGSLDF